MISTIIQLAALALIAVALFRESKRDRIQKIQEKAHLCGLFHDLRQFIASDTGALRSSIKAQIELSYAERYDEILKRFEYFAELIEVYVTQDAISKDEFARLHKCVSDNNVMLSKIRADLESTLNSQLSTLNRRLLSLETPIKIWGEAQTQNVVHKGEANRTLRRRIQEKESVLIATRQTLGSQAKELAALKSQLADTRSAASAAVAYLAAEISATRAWMEERGIPCASLDKHLSLHFKGSIPSEAWKRNKNQADLKTALEDFPSPTDKMPLTGSQNAVNH